MFILFQSEIFKRTFIKQEKIEDSNILYKGVQILKELLLEHQIIWLTIWCLIYNTDFKSEISKRTHKAGLNSS